MRTQRLPRFKGTGVGRWARISFGLQEEERESERESAEDGARAEARVGNARTAPGHRARHRPAEPRYARQTSDVAPQCPADKNNRSITVRTRSVSWLPTQPYHRRWRRRPWRHANPTLPNRADLRAPRTPPARVLIPRISFVVRALRSGRIVDRSLTNNCVLISKKQFFSPWYRAVRSFLKFEHPKDNDLRWRYVGRWADRFKHNMP